MRSGARVGVLSVRDATLNGYTVLCLKQFDICWYLSLSSACLGFVTENVTITYFRAVHIVSLKL